MSKEKSTMISFTEESVERRLTFKPRVELGNLCRGYIESVELVEVDAPKFDDKGVENSWEYAGYKIPSLVITFCQDKTKEDPRARYYVETAKVVSSRTNKGDDIPMETISALYTQMYDKLRHITNSFKGLKNYDLKKGTCPGIDPKASIEVRLNQFKDFFQYFKELLEGTGGSKEPMYKDVKLWMKLVADFRTGKFLTFPTFVGKGFIERAIENIVPSIEFEAGESVTLVASKKGKTEKSISESSTITNEDVANIVAKYA